MSSRGMRALIGVASALGIGLITALPTALPAGAAPAPHRALRLGHALYDVGVHSHVTPAQAAGAARAATSFKQYTATVNAPFGPYTYTIAGKNPAIKHSNPVSTIQTVLVPLIIKTPFGTWNPDKKDSCDSGASATTRTVQSPIFVSQPWTWGGTSIGTGQVTDAFQRAEFWKYAKPSGINPGFAVNLKVRKLAPVTINVPEADQANGGDSCGNGLEEGIEISWLDGYLQSTVIPSLASKGVSPATVPIFLTHNVIEYVGTVTDCCVVGYHSALSTSSGIQTYVVADYDNGGNFPVSPDISPLSNEIAEWQNDPYDSNQTPSWGNIGPVTNCTAGLEVGDPLAGTNFTDTVGSFTYHPQELAFFSWFYRQSPSLGVHGWYSDQGTFRTPSTDCN